MFITMLMGHFFDIELQTYIFLMKLSNKSSTIFRH